MSTHQLPLTDWQAQNAAIFNRASSWAIIAGALNPKSSVSLTPLRKATLSAFALSCFANFISYEIFEDNLEDNEELNALLKKISVFAGSALTLSAVLDIINIYQRSKWTGGNLPACLGSIFYTLSKTGYAMHKWNLGLQILSSLTSSSP